MLVEILIALAVASVCTVLLALLLGMRAPNRIPGYLSFFLFLFMAAWAGGLWLKPLSPELWGRAWLGFVLTGLVFWLALAQFLSRMPTTREHASKVTALGIGVFLYLMTFLLMAAVAMHYSAETIPE